MKSMKFIGCLYLLALLSACGSRTSDYDATGTFEATEVLVSAEASGKLLYFHVEEGTRLKAGEEVGLIDTLQLYLKKLQLQASMKSVESQRCEFYLPGQCGEAGRKACISEDSGVQCGTAEDV